MFTGIIEALGKVESLRSGTGGVRRLTIKTDLDVGKLPIGGSIAVNGACLTIVAKRSGRPASFQADLGPETLACTTLEHLVAGSRVHLEPALRLGDPMGGHMMSGHVDGVGQVVAATKHGSPATMALRVRGPEEIAPYLVRKGSIAIDGVSLTLNHVDGAVFEVLLIPHTLGITLLGERRAGDQVNLEADLIAKQVARWLERTHDK